MEKECSKQYYLNPDSAAYRQGIFDVIRIFLPSFAWSETAEEAEWISIQRDSVQWVIQIGEESIILSVDGLDENQCRKKMKQAIYRYFAKLYGGRHPWGIMTGIRPTKIVHRYRDSGMDQNIIKETIMEEYFLREDKADLLMEVTERQRPLLCTQEMARSSVSIYLSIPFCPTRCHYCSFPSFSLPKPELQEQYINNLLKECAFVSKTLNENNITIDTVYIGGGTPTSLSVTQQSRLLEGIARFFGTNFKEYTIEAGRPDTITAEKLQLMHDFDVDRISINPQTFSQKTLDAIGRRHSVQEVFDLYAVAREIGFHSINMDLIAGLTGETIEDFQHSLSQISILKPENVTVHTLAIKRTAKLDRTNFNGNQADIVTGMNRYLQEWIKSEAYVPYYLYRQKQMIGDMENTGYCLEGKESIYNIQMMEERQSIVGLGVGSTSKYVNPSDWTLTQKNNPKDLYFYNERIDELIAQKQTLLRELFMN